MRIANVIIVGLFMLISVGIHVRTWMDPAAAASPKSLLPNIVNIYTPGANTFPSNHWVRLRIDTHELNASIQRKRGIRECRQMGNSLRVSIGYEMTWIFYENRKTPVFLGIGDIPVARGLTPSNQDMATRVTRGMIKKNATLLKDGWSMWVMPIPTRVSVYREWIRWPVMDENMYERSPLNEDRTDELVDYIFSVLRESGVHFLDLRNVFRKTCAPVWDGTYVFPPGESHWSGRGIELAASELSEVLSRDGSVKLSTGKLLYKPIRWKCDFASAFDLASWWPSKNNELLYFEDRIVVGRTPDPVSPSPSVLIVVAGTSYSGQYWASIPGVRGDFPFVVHLMINNAAVHNRSRAGRGSYESFGVFLSEKDAISADFEKQYHCKPGSYRKIVIWEFPFRDLGTIMLGVDGG